MAAAGGAGGSFAQLGTQSIGQSIGFGIGRAQMGDSWDQWKRGLKKGPTYRMEGLRRAGLNPILAAAGGLQGPPTPTNANPAGKGGLGENPVTAGETRNTAKAMQDKLLSEGDLARTQSELVGAQQAEANAKRLFYESQTGINSVRLRETLKSMPQSIGQAVGAGVWNAQSLLDLFGPSDPNQRNNNMNTPERTIVPSDNRRK